MGHNIEKIYGCRSLEVEIDILRLLASLEANVSRMQNAHNEQECFAIWEQSERLVHDIAFKYVCLILPHWMDDFDFRRLPADGVRDAVIARTPMPARPTSKPTVRDVQSLITVAYAYSTIDPDCKLRLLMHLAKVNIGPNDSAFHVDHLHVIFAHFFCFNGFPAQVYPLGFLKYILRRLKAAFATKAFKKEANQGRNWLATFNLLWSEYPRNCHAPTSYITSGKFTKEVSV